MSAKIVPYLSYPDASVAVDWLVAMGFVVVALQKGADGTVLHAELRRNEAVVMLASDDQEYRVSPLVGQSTGAGIYLVVDDVDEIYASAIRGGAASVFAPEDTEWGSRRARVLDPAGREWSFGTHEPGTQTAAAQGAS